MKQTSKPNPCVFGHLVNKTASVDKMVVSVDGKLKEHFRENELSDVNAKAILRPGSLYAACIFAIWPLTGNPVSIHHGRVVKFRNVPSHQFAFQSESIPVTSAQVNLLVRKCMEEKPAPVIAVSSIELTFDVTDTTVDYIQQGDVRVLTDEWGSKTIYVGSPRSAWQVRIYQKNLWVVRIEFILRKQFLSKSGISSLEEVLLLSTINIWQLLSVRRFSRSSAKRATKKLNELVRSVIVDSSRFNRPRDTVLFVLRRNRINPTLIFKKTNLQRKLETMQRRLIW
jgi:hypothetical protein